MEKQGNGTSIKRSCGEMDQKSTKRSFEGVLSYLEELILSRKIEPGDRLPSERTIVETHKISRGTVRVVFRALEQKGLIVIKKGAGAFVSEGVDPEHIGGTLATLIRHQKVSLSCLIELREAIEINAASYAAERGEPDDILSLKKSLQELESLYSAEKKNFTEFWKHEMDMHHELVVISNNPLFNWISTTLILNVGATRHLISHNKKYAKSALSDWCDIVSALENRQTMLVRSLLASHLVNFKRILSSKIEK